MLLTVTLVAVIAGVLAHAGGAGLPDAILKSGAAFAGTFGLSLAVAHYMARDR
jgi:hypothetical protein